jgi:hypothetical protein
MPSPFPGMDPYLEGRLWPDVHTSLATTMRQRLAPLVRPRYTVRLGVYVAEDSAPEAEIGIMYPDVEVLLGAASPIGEGVGPSGGPTGGPTPTVGTPAALTIPVVSPVEARLVTVEIRDVASDTLVTAIEILSPINKTGEGLATYRRKRQRLHRAGVHLLELDLIRRGTRPVAHPRIPPVPYLAALTRGQAATTEIWPIGLQDRLPNLPVPLRPPDKDVELDLQATLATVYETAMYDLSIDYRAAPPPPVLSDHDARWVADLLGWGR